MGESIRRKGAARVPIGSAGFNFLNLALSLPVLEMDFSIAASEPCG